MTIHSLSFAQARILRPDVVELIVNAGVEVSVAMVQEWIAFMETHAAVPALLLLNKRHRYSYSFAAQEMLGRIACVRAVAVVNTSFLAQMITSAVLAVLPQKPAWMLATFSSREEALRWLLAMSGNRAAVPDR